MSTRKLAPGAFKRVPAAFMTDIELGKPAMRVGLYLAFHADNETHECCHSTQMMADRLQMSRSLIIGALGQLVSRGHLLRRRRSEAGRGQTSSAYALVFRAPAPAEMHAPEGSDIADQEMAQSDPNVPDGLPSPSVSLDQSNWSPAPGDRSEWSPGGGPVTSFGGAGDQFLGGPVTSSGGHVLDSLTRKEGLDDDERAHAREASSSSDDQFSDEGQALLIFDEMAGRLGWPIAGRLTTKERKAMTARLRDANGLQGWRAAMAEAERSAYLAGTRPGLKFFLDEDHFAQLMRGRYGAEFDPPSRGPDIGGAIDWVFDHRAESGGFSADTVAPSPEPPRPVDELAAEIATMARCVGRPGHVMRVKVRECREQLMTAGLDADSANAAITAELQALERGPYMLDQLRQAVATMASNLRRAAA